MRRPILKTQPSAEPIGDVAVGTLPGGTTVVAASVATGRGLLVTVDDYLQRQSRFDRQARVCLRAEVVDVTVDIYRDYVASQVMSWTKAELAALRTIVAATAELFERLSLRLPETIHLVKTSGQEEGYAAYTRREDTVVLPANMVASVATATSYGDPLHPTDDVSYLQGVFVHECFHLFSKNNPEARYRLYELVGYRPTGNLVEVPDVPWGAPGAHGSMRDLRVTNPDEPDLDIYIELVVPANPQNKDGPLVKRPLLPLLLATGPYTGGIFFEYLQWWFMAIEQGVDGRWRAVLDPEGRPLLYDSGPLQQEYLKRVGANFTAEIFEPDEILAQNFVLVADQPSLGLLTAMKEQLGAHRKAAS
ncbi:hypothetical protein [Nannocystis radixulma]|uniref:Uncharacterized protein n=1 Tax=Nannocystis radixulma TaxID=2995305 RepID=A0ABT5B3F9_9BACT|nr:hypothetical protein [Nannocystis radixulma]MDC0668268.1 hypothetical protein [Nannocystis radixulma]